MVLLKGGILQLLIEMKNLGGLNVFLALRILIFFHMNKQVNPEGTDLHICGHVKSITHWFS